MKILVTNDDGYKSDMLIALAKKLEKYGEVYIVAPDVVMSGKSIGLTIMKYLELHKRGEKFYSLEGTPADCVAFGLTGLCQDFDLVVSGINYGHNISYDTMHSGTCGACIEALSYNTPCIAISMEYNHEIMINYLEMALDFIFDHNLISKEYFINVNFPVGNEVKGIKFTRLVARNDKKFFVYKDNLVYPRRIVDTSEYEEDTEIYAVNHGYISLCPMTNNVFDKHLYKELKDSKNL